MFQVSIDPVASSAISNIRAPARSEQSDDSDDFGALVDSNAAAAASASSAQSRQIQQSRSRPADDASDTARNDTGAVQDNRPPVQDHNDSDARPSSSDTSASQASQPVSSSRTRDRSDKDEDKDDDSDSRKKAAKSSADGSDAAVVAAVAGADGAKITSEADKTAGDGDGVQAATADKGALAATIALEAKAQAAPAAANGQPPGAEPVGIAPDTGAGEATAAGLISAEVAAGGKNGAAKAAKQATEGQASAKPADAKVPGDQPQPQNADPNASSDTNGAAAAGNGGDQAKTGSPVAAKHEAAPAAQAATRDHSGSAVQNAQPDTNFQSVLNLQVPQVQQPATGNFTVTNAGPANSAQALSAPVPVSGIAADIASKLSAGNSSFQIRLDPGELGRIDVRLEVDKHGQVTSHLTVEHPATLDLLRNEAPKLQQALENAGLKTGDSGLQFSLRDQSSQGRSDNGGQNHNSQRLIISEAPPATQAASNSYGRLRGSGSGVDISI